MDTLHYIFSSTWTILVGLFCVSFSIFVHELGHFLAARWRGMHVERFSIGFGPALWKRRGKDGVEYRISAFPLGGYVLLPQLADLGLIEGESSAEVEKLPPVTYSAKMIVAVAGAAFNVLFALLLGCVIWIVGLPMSVDSASTRIGYVQPKIDLPDKTSVTSPAAAAGLRPGDVIRAVDGMAVADWQDVIQALATGSGHSADGGRVCVLAIEREGQMRDVTLYPLISGEDRRRRIGITPAYEPIVLEVKPDSAAAKAGLLPKDRLVSVNATPILNLQFLEDSLKEAGTRELPLTVKRGEGTVVLALAPAKAGPLKLADFGADFTTDIVITHPTPFAQLASGVSRTVLTLTSLLNPHSDIGLKDISGAVGMVHMYSMAVEDGLIYVVMLSIMINVSLAVSNLLPIPVLDGGHMLFATIAKLRGRALPVRLVTAAQGTFMVLLLSLMLYVNLNGLINWVKVAQPPRAEKTTPAAAPAQAK
jgi:regulator of sigma E protease